MSLGAWLHFVHVLAAMVWVGGGLLLSLLGLRARADPRARAEFARTLPYVGLRLLLPAVVVVLLSGVGLVLTSAAWNFAQGWVLLALGLFALAFLIGALYLGRVGIALERAAANGGGARQAAALLDRWLLGYGAVLVVLLVAVWDMVFKPGA